MGWKCYDIPKIQIQIYHIKKKKTGTLSSVQTLSSIRFGSVRSSSVQSSQPKFKLNYFHLTYLSSYLPSQFLSCPALLKPYLTLSLPSLFPLSLSLPFSINFPLFKKKQKKTKKTTRNLVFLDLTWWNTRRDVCNTRRTWWMEYEAYVMDGIWGVRYGGCIKTNQIKSNQTKPYQARPGQARSNQTKPDQTNSNEIKLNQISPNQTRSGQVRPNQTWFAVR